MLGRFQRLTDSLTEAGSIRMDIIIQVGVPE